LHRPYIKKVGLEVSALIIFFFMLLIFISPGFSDDPTVEQICNKEEYFHSEGCYVGSSNIRLVAPEDFSGDFIVNYLVSGSNVALSDRQMWIANVEQ